MYEFTHLLGTSYQAKKSIYFIVRGEGEIHDWMTQQ